MRQSDAFDRIIDHSENPRYRGALESSDIFCKGTNSFCGDEVQFRLQTEGGRVVNVAWKGHGCTLSQASASMLSELVMKKQVTEIVKISEKEMLAMIGIPLSVIRSNCALLPLRTLIKALVENASEPYDQP